MYFLYKVIIKYKKFHTPLQKRGLKCFIHPPRKRKRIWLFWLPPPSQGGYFEQEPGLWLTNLKEKPVDRISHGETSEPVLELFVCLRQEPWPKMLWIPAQPKGFLSSQQGLLAWRCSVTATGPAWRPESSQAAECAGRAADCKGIQCMCCSQKRAFVAAKASQLGGVPGSKLLPDRVTGAAAACCVLQPAVNQF